MGSVRERETYVQTVEETLDLCSHITSADDSNKRRKTKELRSQREREREREWEEFLKENGFKLWYFNTGPTDKARSQWNAIFAFTSDHVS